LFIAQLTLKKSEIEFSQSRLELDRSTSNYVKDRDNEMFQVRKGAEDEVRETRQEKDEMSKMNLRLEANGRQLERKVRDLEVSERSERALWKTRIRATTKLNKTYLTKLNNPCNSLRTFFARRSSKLSDRRSTACK